MKFKNRIVSTTLILSLLLLCSCSLKTGGNNTDKPVNKKDIVSSSPVTNTPTTVPTNSPTKSPDKSNENKKTEAVSVIKDYFKALKEYKTKDPSRYCTEKLHNDSYSNTKDVTLKLRMM